MAHIILKFEKKTQTTVINDWAEITHSYWILKTFDTPPHELLKSKLFNGIGGKTLCRPDVNLSLRLKGH